MFVSVADLGLKLILPAELKELLEEIQESLEVAGGDGRVNQIEYQTGSTLALFRSEEKFSNEDLDLVDRLLRAAIGRKRSEWDGDE